MDDLLSKGGASFWAISAAKQLILRAIRFVMEVMSGEGAPCSSPAQFCHCCRQAPMNLQRCCEDMTFNASSGRVAVTDSSSEIEMEL
jgi:hypothetical protein